MATATQRAEQQGTRGAGAEGGRCTTRGIGALDGVCGASTPLGLLPGPGWGEARRLSAKPHAILINFMTARRLRAYPLPATRRAAPSASSSETRMHAACMVPTTLLSHYIGSYPRCERGAALRTPIDCPSCYFYPQVPHDLYSFSYRICHSYVSSPSRAHKLLLRCLPLLSTRDCTPLRRTATLLPPQANTKLPLPVPQAHTA